MSNKLPSSLIKKLEKDSYFETKNIFNNPQKTTNTTQILNPDQLGPYLHAGCYCLIEKSSSYLIELIQKFGLNHTPLKALDLCASNGVNSLILNSSLHPDSLIICNEAQKNKSESLVDNLIRWGYPNTITTQNDFVVFNKTPNYFDLIIVDTTGYEFCKDEVSKMESKIFDSIIHSLKPDGYLFFTSKLNSNTPEKEHATTVVYSKKENLLAWNPRKVKFEKPIIDYQQLEKWVVNPEKYFQFSTNEAFFLFPKLWHDDFKMLKTILNIKRAGTALGKFDKRKELIPHHELACSIIKSPEIPKIELTLHDAIAYLQGEQINPSTNMQGWLLACIDSHSLGWLKVLAGRANNYYPKKNKGN